MALTDLQLKQAAPTSTTRAQVFPQVVRRNQKPTFFP